MKVSPPAFCEGTEWRKLTPAERAGKKWKYILLKDVFIEVETGVRAHYECVSRGTIYMVILPHGIVMKKGYAWNGNTASPDAVFRTSLLLPSLPHDGLFQFSGAEGFPAEVTLRWTNCLYFSLSPHWIGWAYWTGLFVGSWTLWTRPPKEDERVFRRLLHAKEPT